MDKPYAMLLSKEEVEWVINRERILQHIYSNRHVMCWIYASGGQPEGIWEELRKQIS